MKKRKFYSLLTAILLVCTLFLSLSFTACKPKNPNPDSGSTSVKATVTGITLDTASVKKSFEYAEAFTYEGLKVTAQMSDKTTKNVDLKDCKISEPDTSRAGKRNITVSYEGKTAFYQITVAKRFYPDITKEALLAITGENDSVAYRVEAENIDMAVSSVKKQNSATNFVAQAPLDAEITSGNAYLTNYGVKYNYFGYKFTSDKAYEGVTIVLRLAYSGNDALSLNNNFALYLNRAETDEGVVGEISMEGYTVSGGTCVWSDLVLRAQTIKEGENTMTFDVLSENVPDIDYIDFYVGKRYISSIVEIAEKKEYVKEIEDFNTEKAYTKEDVAKFHHLEDGQLFVETVKKESAGKTTSGGKSVGAIAKGSQLSTTLRLADKATVKITFVAATYINYKVKDNWKFSIDGIELDAIEDVNIRGGNPAKDEYWDWIPTSLGIYNLAAGDHLFLVEVTGGDCNVDCVKFEVISLGEYSSEYSSIVEIAEKKEYVKEIEDFNTEKAYTKEDVAKFHHLEDGQLFVETVKKESAGKTTSGGKSVGAIAKGSQLSATLRLADKATVKITFVAAKYSNYKVKDNWKFSIDGIKLNAIEDVNIRGGNPSKDEYWDWIPTSLGIYNLAAGDHRFLVEVTGEDCNVDCVKFEVISFGEYDESGIAVGEQFA